MKKVVYDNEGRVYAIGTFKECNKIYSKIILAYPNKTIYMGDVDKEKKKDCIGAKREVSFKAIRA